MKPRASRTALITASVPELTKRTRSHQGSRAMNFSASSTSRRLGAPKLAPSRTASNTAASTSGSAWPRISGPQLWHQSTYSRPSSSVKRPPRALRKNSGSPGTDLKARTGEFTPPGSVFSARSHQEALLMPASPPSSRRVRGR